MFDEVDVVFKQVEGLLRNANSKAISDTARISMRLLNWFSSVDAADEVYSLSDKQKSSHLELAVKLHNKARNLVAAPLTEVRTLLKATSAWMLTLYGGEKAKTYVAAIKILSKCGQEFSALHPAIAQQCFLSTIDNWKKASSKSIQLDASPLELEDLKTAVFWSYVEVVRCRSCCSGVDDYEHTRKHISEAIEIMQTLPSRLKFTLAEEVMTVAYRITEQESTYQLLMMDESTYYFKTVLHIIDSAMLPDSNVEGISSSSSSSSIVKIDMLKVKINAQLALSFIYMEQSQCDKALAYVNCIEASLKLLDHHHHPSSSFSSSTSSLSYQQMNAVKKTTLHQINYCKFLIFLKDKDPSAAEASLWELLNCSLTPFQIALDSVKLLMTAQGDSDSYNEAGISKLYKCLASKYPNDPELMRIRLSHMQAILVNVRNSEEESGMANDKALEITKSIISDHCPADWSATASIDNFESFKKIIADRIAWHRSMKEYISVVGWCQKMQMLLANVPNQTELLVAVLLQYSDALLYLKRPDEAYDLSKLALETTRCTRTMIMTFKAMLHMTHTDEEYAVAKFMSLQQQQQHHQHHHQQHQLQQQHHQQHQQEEIVRDDPYLNSRLEHLSRIILSCYTIQESTLLSDAKRGKVITLLLKEWMHMYVSCKAWKVTAAATTRGHSIIIIDIDNSQRAVGSGGRDAGEEREDTYLTILCELLTTFMSNHFESRLIMDMHDGKVGMGMGMGGRLQPVVQPLKATATAAAVMGLGLSKPIAGEVEKALDATTAATAVDEEEERAADAASSPATAPQSHERAANDTTHTVVAVAVVACVSSSPCDLLTRQGYPDSIDFNGSIAAAAASSSSFSSSSPPAVTKYTFKCSMKLLSSEFLRYFEDLVSLIVAIEKEEKEERDGEEEGEGGIGIGDHSQHGVSSLGAVDELMWVANLSWNIATLLTRQQQEQGEGQASCSSSSILFTVNDCEPTRLSTDREKEECLLLVARLYELTHFLFERMMMMEHQQHHQHSSSTNDLTLCLLLSAAARIDADSYSRTTTTNTTAAHLSSGLTSLTKPSSSSSSSSSSSDGEILFSDYDHPSSSSSSSSSSCIIVPSNNLLQARLSIHKANRQLKALSDFEDDESRHLRRSSLIFEFYVLCRLRDTPKCRAFLLEHRDDFLLLPPQDLLYCSKISRRERGVSIEITRTLLTLSLQASNMRPTPDYTMIGGIYRDLIELSPSRTSALEHVEEFEQLICNASSSTLQPVRFDVCDIDYIVSLSYNYGVTLIDLDQILLAERFVTKALHLISFCSDALKGWLPKLQDTSAHITQVKADSLKGSHRFDPLQLEDRINQLSSNPQDQVQVDELNAGSQKGDGAVKSNSKKRTIAAVLSHASTAMKDAPITVESLIN